MRFEKWRMTGIGKPVIHFMPVDDLIEHEESADCVCGPHVGEPLPGRTLYRHHRLIKSDEEDEVVEDE